MSLTRQNHCTFHGFPVLETLTLTTAACNRGTFFIHVSKIYHSFFLTNHIQIVEAIAYPICYF